MPGTSTSSLTLQTLRLAVILPLLFFCGCSQKIDTHQEFVEVAWQHERKDELPEAIVAYRKALEKNPDVASTWYDLGVAYAAMNQSAEAVDAYTKAVDLDPAMARAFNNRAAVYAQLKDFENAVIDCDHAIALNPNDALAWRNRGLAYHDLGELKKATADYDESIRISGRIAQTYHYRGNVYLELDQPERALEDFNHAIHLDDELPAVWLSQAKALARLGRGEEAQAALAKASTLGAETDVDLDSLSPANAPAATIVNQDQQQPAVDFVADWLTKKGTSVVADDGPWDLRVEAETATERFLVRVVDGKSKAVRFQASDLSQLTDNKICSTTLIVVSRCKSADAEDDNDAFEILLHQPDWVPNYSTMKPAVWSLPLPPQTLESNKSVTSTK